MKIWISTLIGNETVSLAVMKYICGSENKVSHRALEDTADLRRIVCAVMTGQWINERICEVKNYIAAKNRYHSYRRFYENNETVNDAKPFDESLLELGKRYAYELNKYITPEIMALRDDILVLQSDHAIGFLGLDEYRMVSL